MTRLSARPAGLLPHEVAELRRRPRRAGFWLLLIPLAALAATFLLVTR